MLPALGERVKKYGRCHRGCDVLDRVATHDLAGTKNTGVEKFKYLGEEVVGDHPPVITGFANNGFVCEQYDWDQLWYEDSLEH